MRGFFVIEALGFQLNLKLAVCTRLWPLPMSAHGKDLVFDLLVLYLTRLHVRMKSIWLWSFPLGAYQVAVLDSWWGWEVLAMVSQWIFSNSRSLHALLFVSPMTNLPTVHAQCWYASEPTLAFQSPFWESLVWCYQPARSCPTSSSSWSEVGA